MFKKNFLIITYFLLNLSLSCGSTQNIFYIQKALIKPDKHDTFLQDIIANTCEHFFTQAMKNNFDNQAWFHVLAWMVAQNDTLNSQERSIYLDNPVFYKKKFSSIARIWFILVEQIERNVKKKF